MAALTPVVVAMTPSGARLGRTIANHLGAPLHGRSGRVAPQDADEGFDETTTHLTDLFASGRPIIALCAAGILIRAIAPLLGDKTTEPAVVAVAENGASVVPLLGGHRGANRLARKIAAAIEGHAAITTAGDLALGLPLDAPPAGWRAEERSDLRRVMADLVAGSPYQLAGPCPDWLAELAALPFVTTAPGDGPAVRLVPKDGSHDGVTYWPQTLTLGVGCARNCAPDELISLADAAIAESGQARESVACVVSLDLKADEAAVDALARHFGCPARFFDADRLSAETARLANPSDVVLAEVGCPGVAEGAALAAAGTEARLTIPKIKSAMATAAIATAPAPITTLPGRRRGSVSLIGLGPGQSTWRTPEASRLIAAADEVVGYSLYLDLAGTVAAEKVRSDFPLGAEEARCRHALESAAEGRNVALLCSGDAGIYAMGALVWELLATPGAVSDAARRVEIVTSPGISAMQAAAARAGAPLGHDFCAVSLSDLLTPRDAILRRLAAAAEGDFVTALYNPASRTRRDLLSRALAVFADHRAPDTPIIIARSLGRPDESVRVVTLDTLDPDEIDMMTVLIIGSTATRQLATGDGARVYTPRGYARKAEAAE